ncbi:hypothetical protein VCR17J2_100036 [Vibrio coralliirubri]|nr:hypothetical protein VCR1J2_80036 [Vibrio coralliirubri]CDU10920.1 hypothetical protein VCR17J2_100036 [Vibrio coralliirubri]
MVAITSNGVGVLALQQGSGFKLLAYSLDFKLYKNGESYDSPFLYLTLFSSSRFGL